jgi:hypothetical protein
MDDLCVTLLPEVVLPTYGLYPSPGRLFFGDPLALKILEKMLIAPPH